MLMVRGVIPAIFMAALLALVSGGFPSVAGSQTPAAIPDPLPAPDGTPPLKSFNLGVQLGNAGRCKEALPFFLRALAEYPTWSKLRVEIIRCQLETGAQAPDIRPHLEAARKDESETARFCYYDGRYQEMTENYPAAVQAYQKALSLRAGLYDAPARLREIPAKEKALAERRARETSAPAPQASETPRVSPLASARPAGSPPPVEQPVSASSIAAMLPPEPKLMEPVPSGASGREKEGMLAMENGRRAAMARDYAAARRYFQEALGKFPNEGLVRLELAICHFNTDNDLNAIEKELAAAADSQGANPRFHYWLGRMFENLGEYGRAAESYEEALKLRPGVHDARKRLADAREAMRGAADPSPGPLPAGDGSRAAGIGRKAPSVMVFQTRIRDALTARNHLIEGQKAMQMGDYPRALASLEKAAALAPAWAAPQLELGAALLASGGDLNRTGAALDMALQHDPANARVYGTLGQYFEQVREGALAVEMYRRALAIDEGLTEFRLRLAEAEERLGNTAAARQEYARVLDAQPGNPAVRLALARVCEKLGDSDSSDRQWSELVSRFPRNGAFLLRYADYLERRGRAAEAEAQRLKATELESAAGKGGREMRPLLREDELRKKRKEKKR
ncbi:MAG: Beta-barrel assembly-enhancing protease [Myxococcota bacterium]|nr:Beta-barrel assembly-enhancing protease [Myxococcota bacterium]